MPKRLYNQPDAENINFRVIYHDEPDVLSDVCLFSSFSFAGIVEEYVYYYLQELKKANRAIAFITTSPLQPGCIKRLSEYTFLIIERDNRCPDFGSWKAGLSLLDWGKNLNSVLLVNDSVFGPLYNISEIIDSMKDRFDVWGMTESKEVDLHIQSYFIYFNRTAIEAPIFSNFWKQVDLMATKDEVIHRYEVGLSTLFRSNNFRFGAYARIDELTQNTYSGHRVTNPTLVFWKALIQKHRFPFIKRELLIKMNISKTYWMINLYINTSGWKKTIEQNTQYPVNLITAFLHNYYDKIQATTDVVLQQRKMLVLTRNMDDNDDQRLLMSFLNWMKKETNIRAEIIVCEKGHNDLENEFASLGVVTNFYELSNVAKRNLKERLIDEIALLLSNSIDNIAIQKFFSYTYIPQIVFTNAHAAGLKNYLALENTSWLQKNVSHFITTSTASKKALIEGLSLAEDKIDLLYKFADPVLGLVPEKIQKETRAELGILTGSFVIGMTGDAESGNSTDLLPIIATELCRDENDIHIIWLGNQADVVKYEQVYADLTRNGLSKRVHLLKKKVDNKRYINAFDIFISVAREDGFAIINVQNALAGKPVICFEQAESVKEYAALGAAHTVPYLDIKALSAKVFLYYNNRSLLKTEKQQLLPVANNEFSTRVQAPKMLGIIKKYYDAEELILKEEPVLTFFVHIYYENSWDEIRNKLKNFDNGKNHFLFSISEACLIKEHIIEDIKKSFKTSYALITSNIGKDIGGKMALIDLYLLLNLQSPFLVFLHDKQSPHSIIGETWKKGLFKIVDPSYQKHIVGLFKDATIGIVGDKDNIVNEYDPGTGRFRNNSQLSKRLLLQFEMAIDNYDFLGGSMYWIRSSIIQKFFEKNNPILMRENLEAGNVLDLHEERMAHTWERMFSWIATSQGFTIKGI